MLQELIGGYPVHRQRTFWWYVWMGPSVLWSEL